MVPRLGFEFLLSTRKCGPPVPAVAFRPKRRSAPRAKLEVQPGEILAVVGPNGSRQNDAAGNHDFSPSPRGRTTSPG